MPSVGQALSGVLGLLKYLFIAALFGIVGFYLYRNWSAILAWWSSLFGPKREELITQLSESNRGEPEPPPRPFSAFGNPFLQQTDPRQAIVITFQAYEAWMRERGTKRDKDETPDEFVKRTGTIPGALSVPAKQLASAYNRIVYGRGQAANQDLDAAKQLWQGMRPT